MAAAHCEIPAFDSQRAQRAKAETGRRLSHSRPRRHHRQLRPCQRPHAEHRSFLTIAGVSPGCATLDRLIMLDLAGRYLGGDKAAPYEWPIHACIMRARPEVMSVCHTHSKWSALFSVIKGGLRPIHMYAKFLPAGGPPIYPAAGLIGTCERGKRWLRL